MDGLINAGVIADVGAGRKAQTAHKPCAKIADNIAVEVRGHQHIELLRLLHQLHAERINDAVVCGDFGIVGRHLAEGAQEQAVRQLHDIGLVDRRDLFAAVLAGIVKGKAADLFTGGAGDELNAVGHLIVDHVLDALVQILGVLAHDDKIHIVKAGGYARQRMHRAQVGVGGKALTQLHIDAAETLADGGSRGALERPATGRDGVQRAGGDQLAALGGIFGTGGIFLPRNAGIQRSGDGAHTLGDFTADAVARNQNCFHKNTFPFPCGPHRQRPVFSVLTAQNCAVLPAVYLPYYPVYAQLSTRIFTHSASICPQA